VESRTTVPSADEAASPKRFPMHALLYRTLTPPQPKVKKGDEVPAAWEKVLEVEESVSKLSRELRFPASLENVKFQVHLLRRS
jgi:25S rRNA (uracil2843-N3)-methyltransferase